MTLSGNGYLIFPAEPNETYVTGVNASGEIVGFYHYGSFGQYGFIEYNGSYTYIDAPDPSEFGSVTVEGINSYGVAYGNYGWGSAIGFIWNGSFTTVEFPNATNTLVQGVDAAGDAVGVYIDQTLDTYNGFIEKDGNYISVDVPNSTFTYVNGVTSSGEIYGFYSDVAGLSLENWPSIASPSTHGFVYDNGVFTTVGSDVVGLDDSGDVYSLATGSGDGRYINVYSNGTVLAYADTPQSLGAVDNSGNFIGTSNGTNFIGTLEETPSQIANSGLLIADTASNISANLDNFVTNLPLSIVISDDKPLVLTVGQIAADAAALAVTTNANGLAYALNVTDSAANVSIAFDLLNSNAHVELITLIDAGLRR